MNRVRRFDMPGGDQYRDEFSKVLLNFWGESSLIKLQVGMTGADRVKLQSPEIRSVSRHLRLLAVR